MVMNQVNKGGPRSLTNTTLSMTPGPHLEFNFSLGFVPDRVHNLRTYKWFVL